MSKKTELNQEVARNIALALNENMFSRMNSSNAKWNAQSNLRGKTHYVDEDTLRCFYSSITSTYDIDHGLVFTLIESVAADHRNQSRGFRFVAFDLCGTVINERASASRETLFRNSRQAEKAMWAWADEFDTLAHYKMVLTERAERMKKEAAFMLTQSKSIRL